MFVIPEPKRVMSLPILAALKSKPGNLHGDYFIEQFQASLNLPDFIFIDQRRSNSAYIGACADKQKDDEQQ